jgi:glycosyltransferase involved in cell wall biosynthesis
MLRPLTPPRRVLITLDAVGGVWRYAVDLAGTLAAAEMECLLVGLGPPPSADGRREARALSRTDLVWLDQPLDWMVEDEVRLDPIGPRLSALGRQWGADLLHLNVPSQAVGVDEDLAVVTASHSCVATWWEAVRGAPLPDSWKWQAARTRRGLERADRVIVPSAAHGAAVQRVYGLEKMPLVVPNATAAPDVDAPKEPIVLAAGRWWDEGKNGALLDRAAPASPWPVVMAGPLVGPGGQRLDLAHAESLGDLPSDEMGRWMERAALFVAPSRYEPFGLAVLEAAARGCALVLADIPTFRDLWEDCAVFVKLDDAAALAATLAGLAADASRRDALGRAARARALRFTPERQCEALLDAYAGALGRSDTPSPVPMVA